jgi:drug/metabolite transporter (DMT)-like permease
MTIALTMICFYTYPGLVALGAVRFFGDQLDRTRLGALALGSVGLVLVLAPSLVAQGVTADPLGVAMACAASVIQAACVLGVARGFGPVPMVFTGTVLLAFGGVCYVAIAFLTGQLGALVPASPGPSVGLYLALGIVIGAALPTLANLGGIRRVGPSQAAILMMLEVVVGTTMAILFLGERPSILQVVGGVAVLAAGVVLQLPRPGVRLVAQPVPPGA